MGIRYELREYEVDPEDLVAEAVAAKIGPPPGQLFKTLVAEGDRSALHRVFDRPRLKRNQLQKKTHGKISKVGVW